MSYLKLTVITPVHIGSGRELQSGMEMLYDQNSGSFGVIDERRIAERLGQDGIDQWVECIRSGKSLGEMLKTKLGGYQLEELSKRTIPIKGKRGGGGEMKKTRIREQVRSGNGDVLLPGSSLKGGVRTALFTERLKKSGHKPSSNDLRDRKGNFTDSPLQNRVLQQGGDKKNGPNMDLLRAFRLGDAHFSSTEAFYTQVLNQLDPAGEKFEFKEPVGQWVEGLPPGASCSLRGKLDERLIKEMVDKGYWQEEDTKGLDLESIFRTVNEHTEKQMEGEIEQWEEQMDAPEPAAPYLKELKRIKEEHLEEGNKEKKCLFRVGYGTGFLENTGGWQSELLEEEAYGKLMNFLRGGKKYGGFPFPKTRRMAEPGIPLGFVELERIGKEEYHKLFEKGRVEKDPKPGTSEGKGEKAEEPAVETFTPSYHKGKLKVGDLVDAYCLEKDPKDPNVKWFKLFIGEEGEEPVVSCRYPADLVLESYCKVMVTDLDKAGAIKSVKFKKLIK